METITQGFSAMEGRVWLQFTLKKSGTWQEIHNFLVKKVRKIIDKKR